MTRSTTRVRSVIFACSAAAVMAWAPASAENAADHDRLIQNRACASCDLTDAVLTGNVGCLLQITKHLRKTKPNLKVLHPIDVLWQAYETIASTYLISTHQRLSAVALKACCTILCQFARSASTNGATGVHVSVLRDV